MRSFHYFWFKTNTTKYWFLNIFAAILAYCAFFFHKKCECSICPAVSILPVSQFMRNVYSFLTPLQMKFWGLEQSNLPVNQRAFYFFCLGNVLKYFFIGKFKIGSMPPSPYPIVAIFLGAACIEPRPYSIRNSFNYL